MKKQYKLAEDQLNSSFQKLFKISCIVNHLLLNHRTANLLSLLHIDLRFGSEIKVYLRNIK